jgi:hypothetical protein
MGRTADHRRMTDTTNKDAVSVWLTDHFGRLGTKMSSNIKHLGSRQRKFCEAYLTCGDAVQAAAEADLRTSSPQLLLHQPKISAYINLAAAKREHDLGRASAAELLDRVRATPILSEKDNVLPPDLLKELDAQLEGDAKALVESADDELLDNISRETDTGIMQVPKVKLLHNEVFGPEWVIEQLVRVAERSLQIEPVYDRKGRPIGEFTFAANPALKALELVGKTMAMFKERIEVGDITAQASSDIDERIRSLVGAHPELEKLVTVNDISNTSDRQH